MITLGSHQELKQAKDALELLEKACPDLYEKWISIIHLTRALHFKYQYMGALLMNEDTRRYAPEFVQGSVIRLYKRELRIVQDHEEIDALHQILRRYQHAGAAKLSLLALGYTPESLVGTSSIIH
ncbi:hypothetical protein A374_13830 [Fictibacillus macauensis ZFHKF-1]|uniref:Uncharacterized protein n=1 Tax=Fictibacillus macauensis ZFHKF-1 TaxID=1196324 RepID=I8IZ59_9BACL|nr:hypothetical protein [Fictibacillus macauensis]EIT84776.1 hypothetical protein A374_13830 [Fictibacillus macauensis ZFHKF-1]